MPTEKKSQQSAFAHVEKECTQVVREAYVKVDSTLTAKGFTLVSYLDDRFDDVRAAKIRQGLAREGLGPVGLSNYGIISKPDDIEAIDGHMIPDLVLKNSDGEYAALIESKENAIIEVRDSTITDEMRQLATEWERKRSALRKRISKELDQVFMDEFQGQVTIISNY